MTFALLGRGGLQGVEFSPLDGSCFLFSAFEEFTWVCCVEFGYMLVVERTDLLRYATFWVREICELKNS